MQAEIDFAFKQAFVLCPKSPEALFRYISFLIGRGAQRYDDALALATTAVTVDPLNVQVQQLKVEIQRIKKGGNRPRTPKPR